MVITETKNYKNQEEVYNNNRPLYNAMRKYNLSKQCFPNTHFKPFKNEIWFAIFTAYISRGGILPLQT